ncbi:MAG: nucleoside phosphorylase [Candidatus Woesearchaeota archaeon]
MGFPNLKNKHLHDSMFSPVDYIKYKKSIGTFPKETPPVGVILCYSKDLMVHVLGKHKTTRVQGAFYDRFYLIKDTNYKIGIIGDFGVGSPVASVVLEEMIGFGVKRFISLGYAGTLQKNIKIGDLMVCEKAIRDEGTSYHYIKHSKYAKAPEKITSEIKQSLHKFNLKYFVGTSWTIDAPYRETVAEAKQYQKEGVATVDMEASALFAVAKYRKVELGSIFTISDSLAELEWKPKFHLNKTKKGLETLYKVAVDVLLKD